MRVRSAAAVALTVLTASCAAVPIKLPEGPSRPVSPTEASDALLQATESCRGVRTLTAEIGLSGRIGTQKLRGRVLTGFERQSGSLRFEAPAPFGAPIFILAARANRATLVLPRGNYVLRDAQVADVIEALTGLRRNTEDLLALIAGCVVADSRLDTRDARRFDSGWMALPLAGGSDAFLKSDANRWRLLSGRSRVEFGDREMQPWLVAYSEFTSGFPSIVRLTQPPDQTGRGGDVTFRVSQLEANVPVDPAAFAVRVPDKAAPITLDELRQMGPLADQSATTKDR